MKFKILLLIIFTQISLICHSQKAKTTSKKTTNTIAKKQLKSSLDIARQDFCSNVETNYYYGSSTFKSWFIISARDIGITSPYEIEKEVQNINKNGKLQEAFFKHTNSLGGSRDFKIQQFYQLGMTLKNATVLADYMIAKYNIVDAPVEQHYTKNVLAEEIEKLTNSALAKKIYPKERYVNDSTFIMKRGNDMYHMRFIDKEPFVNNNDEEIVLILASYKIVNGVESNQPVLELIVTDILDEEGRSYIVRGMVYPYCDTKDLVYNVVNIYDKACFAIGNINDVNEDGNIKQRVYSLTKNFYNSSYTTTLNKDSKQLNKN